MAHKKGRAPRATAATATRSSAASSASAARACSPGTILVRQCGTVFHPGRNVGQGQRLHALRAGSTARCASSREAAGSTSIRPALSRRAAPARDRPRRGAARSPRASHDVPRRVTRSRSRPGAAATGSSRSAARSSCRAADPTAATAARGGSVVLRRARRAQLAAPARPRASATRPRTARPGGTGQLQRQRARADLVLDVPVGTQIFDARARQPAARPGRAPATRLRGRRRRRAAAAATRTSRTRCSQAPRIATRRAAGRAAPRAPRAQAVRRGRPRRPARTPASRRSSRASPRPRPRSPTTRSPRSRREVGIAAVGGQRHARDRRPARPDRGRRRRARPRPPLPASTSSAARPAPARRRLRRSPPRARSRPAASSTRELEQILARRSRAEAAPGRGRSARTADDEARAGASSSRALRAARLAEGSAAHPARLSSLTGRGVDQALWAALREVRAAGAGPQGRQGRLDPRGPLKSRSPGVDMGTGARPWPIPASQVHSPSPKPNPYADPVHGGPQPRPTSPGSGRTIPMRPSEAQRPASGSSRRDRLPAAARPAPPPRGRAPRAGRASQRPARPRPDPRRSRRRSRCLRAHPARSRPRSSRRATSSRPGSRSWSRPARAT